MQLPIIYLKNNKEDDSLYNVITTVYKDYKGLKLVIPANETEYLKHHFRNYLSSELMNICINKFQMSPILCPYGGLLEKGIDGNAPEQKAESEDIGGLFKGCGHNGKCQIKAMLSSLDLDESWLLCGYGSKIQCIRFRRDTGSEIAFEMPFDIYFGHLSNRLNDEIDKDDISDLAIKFKELIWQDKLKISKKDETASIENRKDEKKPGFINTIKDANRKEIRILKDKGTPKILIFLQAIIGNLILVPVFAIFYILIKIAVAIPIAIINIIGLSYKASILPGKLITDIKIKRMWKAYEKSIRYMNREFTMLILRMGTK